MNPASESSSSKKRTPFQVALRLVRIIMGFTVILIGLILAIPGVPGPGLAVILVGLMVLATEYTWARRYLQKFKAGGEKIGTILFRRQKGK